MTQPFAVSIDPWTTETIRDWARMDDQQIEHSVERSVNVQKSWSRRSLAERGTALQALAAELQQNRDELAQLAVSEMGKPIDQAIAEVDKCSLLCVHYAENAKAYLASRSIASPFAEARVEAAPLGVILSITPWNFPFWQILRFAIPTLVLGNTVLVKPAPNVLGCAIAIARCVERTLGAGVFSSMIIDHEQAGRLIADHRIAGVALTGSGKAGRAVASQAGRFLKPCLLELGGSDPMIVMQGADPSKTAAAAADARFSNNGQVCIAAKRIIVLREAAQAFTEALVEECRAWRPANPTRSGTRLGPMARADLRDALERQQAALVAKGAESLLEGGPLAGAGFSFTPSVLQLRPDDRSGDEELFGPVATLQIVETVEDAVTVANATPFGLSASVWGEDIGVCDRVAADIEAGSVYINTKPVTHPALPMGGIKQSGFGRELGREGVLAFANIKTVVHGAS